MPPRAPPRTTPKAAGTARQDDPSVAEQDAPSDAPSVAEQREAPRLAHGAERQDDPGVDDKPSGWGAAVLGSPRTGQAEHPSLEAVNPNQDPSLDLVDGEFQPADLRASSKEAEASPATPPTAPTPGSWNQYMNQDYSAYQEEATEDVDAPAVSQPGKDSGACLFGGRESVCVRDLFCSRRSK